MRRTVPVSALVLAIGASLAMTAIVVTQGQSSPPGSRNIAVQIANDSGACSDPCPPTPGGPTFSSPPPTATSTANGSPTPTGTATTPGQTPTQPPAVTPASNANTQTPTAVGTQQTPTPSGNGTTPTAIGGGETTPRAPTRR